MTRDEILAAGHVAPPDAPGPDDGMDPDTIDGLVQQLKEVDVALAELVVPHEEWEVLYRLRLQVERDLLATRDVIEGRIDGEERPGDVGPATRIVQGIGSAAAAVERALGGTPIALVAGAVRHALPERDHDPDALIETSEPEPVAPVARPAETSVSHRAS